MMPNVKGTDIFHLVAVLRRKVLLFGISKMLAVGFPQMPFIRLRKFLSIPSFFRIGVFV